MKKLNLLFIVLSVFVIVSCNHNAANSENEKKSETTTSETLYSLTVTAAANGKITPNKTSEIRAGEEIVLIVEPNDGYQLKSIIVITEEKKDIAVAAVSKGVVYKFTMPIGNVTINSEFAIKTVSEDLTDPQADAAVLYKIEHWLQDVDDLETYELAVVQTKSGEAGEDTTAVAKDFAGFNVLTFNQKTISENGNTVVKIFYNRKTITYTFDPNGGNWDGSTEVKTVSGLYGAVVTVEDPQKAGYDCVWDKPLTVFGLEEETFTATWTARNDTKYTIEIYEQNLGNLDSYTYVESITKTGTTDTLTNYLSDERYGFDCLPYSQININGDGCSTIKLYYNRKLYTVSFETNGGSVIQSQQVLYQGKASVPPDSPQRTNCTFNTWYKDINNSTVFDFDSMITYNTVVYAGWFYNWGIEGITYCPHEYCTISQNARLGDIVYFGDFPQTEVIASVVDKSKGFQIGNMYLYGGDEGNLYTERDGHFYKIEPIEWFIWSKDYSNGNVILLSTKVLDTCNFSPFKDDIHYSIDSNNILYKDSYIREYLNEFFYNLAFSEIGKNKILITTVNPDTQGDLITDLSSTNDKVFLLSYTEVWDSEIDCHHYLRKITGTDYANSKDTSNYRTVPRWWLRSSFDFIGKTGALFINTESFAGPTFQDVYYLSPGSVPISSKGSSYNGVVPAITVHMDN